MLPPSVLAPFLVALPLGPLAGAAADGRAPPPGLVAIPGGRTKIGSAQKDVERLIEQFPALKANFGALSGETPERTVDVEDFFLMVTEVTNEQFAAYVRAANARPPQHWAAGAIDQAREAFLTAEAQKRAEPKGAHQPAVERDVFDERTWWLQNWRGKRWSIPAGLECLPVVFVDYEDALGYARWAGLRLMTEEEYQRAVRGDKERAYPWGDTWEDGRYAATSEISANNAAYAVGSFPAGASEQGVLDLAGNVWEWTASEYERHPGFKPFKITVGYGGAKEIVDTMPDFGGGRRVAVGGSFKSDRHAARGTIRRGTAPDQQTLAMGFRCAASVRRGRDVAFSLLGEGTEGRLQQQGGGGVRFDWDLTCALERWESEPGSCGVPGYAVISAYDYIAFTPAAEVPQAALAEMRADSLVGPPIPLGFFATNQPLIEPPLPPGGYEVAFRGMGSSPATGDAQANELEEALAFARDADQLIFYDSAGNPVAAVPIDNADIGRSDPGKIAIVESSGDASTGAAISDGTPPRHVEIEVVVPTRASRPFKCTLRLRFAPGVLNKDWRG